MSDVHLVVVADEEAAAREAARRLARAAAEGGELALSGGGTVGRTYELAAELVPDWRAATLWWGDDRAVPPDDERSNYALVKATLLDRLDDAPASVQRIRGELGAEPAAAEYDRLLDGVVLDLALNGIGPDGHTASLFPNAPGLTEQDRRAIAAEAALEPFVPRVTMTPLMFAAARELLYVVVGGAKAGAARRAFAGEPDPAVPASLIRGRRTTAILDESAASRL